ncbi:MAG: histidine kinase [Clostridia bacterium]|nr:histidine kinase [Clostridia bacterium]
MSGNLDSAAGLKAFLVGNYAETLGILPALTLLLFLAFIVHIDRYIRPDLKRTMRIIILVLFSLVAQNFLEYRLAKGEVQWLARTLTAIYGYAIRPVILILFLRVIAPQKRFGWAWTLAGVNAAVNATALFSHICFWISEDNHYHGGPLSYMCLYVSVILLVYWFALTIQVFSPHKRKETWVPILVLALIAGGLVLDKNVGLLEQPITYLTISAVIGCVAYYIWLHLQFVREHEQALRAEQRIQIMMTQIQPHFLYNTIATIRALCRRDAEKAGEVAAKFGDYLRQNLDSLNIVGLIPFQKELEHTKIYAEIEMVRFENIRVEYDIQDDRFALPPLTLQPLVENAIRHGVRIRKEGIVHVSTQKTETGHEMIVWDNGKGFDVSQIEAAEGTHIGIRNVRERIEGMCGGTLKVESVLGEGTTVTVTIPAKEKVRA